jgi:hypothetical protein
MMLFSQIKFSYNNHSYHINTSHCLYSHGSLYQVKYVIVFHSIDYSLETIGISSQCYRIVLKRNDDGLRDVHHDDCRRLTTSMISMMNIMVRSSTVIAATVGGIITYRRISKAHKHNKLSITFYINTT